MARKRFLLVAFILVACLGAPDLPGSRVPAADELKEYLRGLRGSKLYLKTALGALQKWADQKQSTANKLAVDIASIDEQELSSINLDRGFFIFDIEYIVSEIDEKKFNKKTDSFPILLTARGQYPRLELIVRGLLKKKVGVAKELEAMLGKVFFPRKAEEFDRRAFIDRHDKELIAKFFTPFPDLARLSQPEKRILLDKIKSVSAVSSLRFERLGDEIYLAYPLGRFPERNPNSPADDELDSSRLDLDKRIERTIEWSLPRIKAAAESLSSISGIRGVCFEIDVWSRDHRKDSYLAGGTTLQKAPVRKEMAELFISDDTLLQFSRDEIPGKTLSQRTTVKIDGTVVRNAESAAAGK